MKHHNYQLVFSVFFALFPELVLDVHIRTYLNTLSCSYLLFILFYPDKEFFLRFGEEMTSYACKNIEEMTFMR